MNQSVNQWASRLQEVYADSTVAIVASGGSIGLCCNFGLCSRFVPVCSGFVPVLFRERLFNIWPDAQGLRHPHHFECMEANGFRHPQSFEVADVRNNNVYSGGAFRRGIIEDVSSYLHQQFHNV